ncbi:MAG: PilZ domain-containing protein [bacterium]
MENNRKFSRLPFKTAASVIISDETDAVPVELIDISLKGALVEFPQRRELPLATQIALRLKLEDSDITIEMKTEVVHVNEMKTGLRCQSIDMESMTHLRRIIELNLGDSTLWEKELLQLG